MAQSLELPLPEITTDDFVRAWSRFELVAAAKKWDEAKQLAYLPTLLRGKLIDIYLELEDDSKADMKTLRSALAEKAGLAKDALSAARAFMERTQRPEEKVADYASQLKKLFNEGYPDEAPTFKVLLQRFVIGLRPPVSQQLLLKNAKPASMDEAQKAACEIGFALSFDKGGVSATVNAVKTDENERLDSLQQAVVLMTKKLEALEAKFEQTQKTLESDERPASQGAVRRQVGQAGGNARNRDRQDKPCFNCGGFGHWRRECPLNYNRPARGVTRGWQGNN